MISRLALACKRTSAPNSLRSLSASYHSPLPREDRMEKQRQGMEKRNTRAKTMQKPSGKLRGNPRESDDVRLSKTLSWILRHGAKSEGLRMREDGYVQVKDLLALPKMRSVDIMKLEGIVKDDPKMRYNLVFEPQVDGASSIENADCWWIRANQGHSIQDVELDHAPLSDAKQVPMAVHGTSMAAWTAIEKKGLSRMTRQHIHLAQGVPGDGVLSGMRLKSKVLIFVDLERAMTAGIEFFLSSNGVVLTKGDGNGFLSPAFFRRVETKDRQPMKGWEGEGPIISTDKLVEGEKDIPTIEDTPLIAEDKAKP